MSNRDLTVSELRELLKPYGTPYRLSLTRAELQRKWSEIQSNEKEYGSAEKPTIADLYRAIQK